MHARSALPLSGIRILDVASFIAAPVAATVLGDYGADVIKVEPLGEGDPNRTIAVVASGYPKSPVNYPWHLDSRGKRSLAIDLKHEQARAAFDRLIATADVLITNYPLASRRRLRLDYEAVARVNPRLIYASFTGYGETGPDADQVGFDTTAYFARSGIMDGARYDDAVPGVTMPAQGDRAAAMALAAAIMIALWNREKTGKGTKVSSSLLRQRHLGQRQRGPGRTRGCAAAQTAAARQAAQRTGKRLPDQGRPLVSAHAGPRRSRLARCVPGARARGSHEAIHGSPICPNVAPTGRRSPPS